LRKQGTAPAGFDATFPCPRAQGDFPDPTDCRGFYQCVKNFAWKQVCPDTLVYNIAARVCDHPQNVDCSSRGGF